MEQKCIQLIEQLLDDPEMKVLPAEEIVKDYLTQKYKESLYDERQYMSSQVPHFSNWNKEKPMELLMVSVDACDVDKTNGNPDALKEEEIKKYEENQTRKVFREKILNFVPDKKLINYWKCILESIEKAPTYKLLDLCTNLQIRSLKSEQSEIPFIIKKDRINQKKNIITVFYECANAFTATEETLDSSEDFFKTIEKNIEKKKILHFNWKIKEDEPDNKILIIDGDFIALQSALLFYHEIGKFYDIAIKENKRDDIFDYESVKNAIDYVMSVVEEQDFYTRYLIEKMTGRKMCICLSYYYTKILGKRYPTGKSKMVKEHLDYIVKQLCKFKNISMRPQIVIELFEPILYFFDEINILEVLNLIGKTLDRMSKDFTDINVFEMDIEKCESYCDRIPERIIKLSEKCERDVSSFILDDGEWEAKYRHIQKLIFYYIMKIK